MHTRWGWYFSMNRHAACIVSAIPSLVVKSNLNDITYPFRKDAQKICTMLLIHFICMVSYCGDADRWKRLMSKFLLWYLTEVFPPSLLRGLPLRYIRRLPLRWSVNRKIALSEMHMWHRSLCLLYICRCYEFVNWLSFSYHGSSFEHLYWSLGPLSTFILCFFGSYLSKISSLLFLFNGSLLSHYCSYGRLMRRIAINSRIWGAKVSYT